MQYVPLLAFLHPGMRFMSVRVAGRGRTPGLARSLDGSGCGIYLRRELGIRIMRRAMRLKDELAAGPLLDCTCVEEV